jgi:benzoyl-CoA reductase/2-hydroxyglutaryl-CoA dehydratase subunit BcrC/BadD/HgdB
MTARRPLDLATYHVQVDLLGRTFLRGQRLRSELRSLVPGRWKHEHLSPPLRATARLKELISSHFLAGRHANLKQKVAWVTSGAPVEPLKALGFYTLYPENHGAVCGVRRAAEDICGEAEQAGYSRDICSYARTDIGSVLSGKTPVGKLPRPDLLLCCTNICQTVLYWYRVLAHHFGVPLILIDTPFVYSEAPEHAVAFVRRQFDEAIVEMERVAGRSLSPKAFERTLIASKEAVGLWLEVLERGARRPAPISAFDEFFHMAPIVEMRGEAVTVRYYRALLRELDRRIERGIGSLVNERKRLIWDNLPIWYWVRPMAEVLAERGVALVASTYTNAWGELAPLIDPEKPLDSLARVYLHPILNQGTGHKLETMVRMVRQYEADGVILHSDRSCKPYSIGQVDQRDRLVREHGVPALLLEADHNDPRVFSEEQARNRLAAFLEVIGA